MENSIMDIVVRISTDIAVGLVIWHNSEWGLLHDIVSEDDIKGQLLSHPVWRATIAHNSVTGKAEYLEICKPIVSTGGWSPVATIKPLPGKQ